MPCIRFALRFALLLLALSFPALAHALSETYEGLLLPDSLEGPIPIVVELRDVGSILTGKVKVSSPLSGSGSIASGENRSGQCNLKVVLNASVTLRLDGSCQPARFEGKYTVYYPQRDAEVRGTFRLSRRSPEQSRKIVAAGATGATVPAAASSACLKANSRCLAACPRGDENAEFMCANHCRGKHQACKGQARKAPPVKDDAKTSARQ